MVAAAAAVPPGPQLLGTAAEALPVHPPRPLVPDCSPPSTPSARNRAAMQPRHVAALLYSLQRLAPKAVNQRLGRRAKAPAPPHGLAR